MQLVKMSHGCFHLSLLPSSHHYHWLVRKRHAVASNTDSRATSKNKEQSEQVILGSKKTPKTVLALGVSTNFGDHKSPFLLLLGCRRQKKSWGPPNMEANRRPCINLGSDLQYNLSMRVNERPIMQKGWQENQPI